MSRRTRVLSTIFLLSACLGCGSDSGDYRTVPVSGTLTCNGKPVQGIQVIFSPQAGDLRDESMPGKSATGLTDENGRFVLSTYGVEDGAVIGTHTVSIMIIEDPRIQIPEESKKNAASCLKEKVEVEITPETKEVQLNFGK